MTFVVHCGIVVKVNSTSKRANVKDHEGGRIPFDNRVVNCRRVDVSYSEGAS